MVKSQLKNYGSIENCTRCYIIVQHPAISTTHHHLYQDYVLQPSIAGAHKSNTPIFFNSKYLLSVPISCGRTLAAGGFPLLSGLDSNLCFFTLRTIRISHTIIYTIIPQNFHHPPASTQNYALQFSIVSSFSWSAQSFI